MFAIAIAALDTSGVLICPTELLLVWEYLGIGMSSFQDGRGSRALAASQSLLEHH